MVGFENDRKIERETNAIINFFEVLAQAKVCDMKTEDYDTSAKLFSIVCGDEKIRKLISDCNEKNIDIVSNSVDDLFYIMKQNIDKMNDIIFSKSKLVEIANERFNNIQTVYFSDKYSIYPKDSNLAAVGELYLLPLPSELVEELLKLTPAVKKIGRR